MQLPSGVWGLSTCVASDQRDQLAEFWMAAPQDQLAALWGTPFGEVTRHLVRQLNPQTQFSPSQIARRESIGGWFNQHGLSHPLAPQLMVANFLYSPPGLLTINNPEQYFPEWLLGAYRELYQGQHNPAQHRPAQPTSTAPAAVPTAFAAPSAPDFGAFPATLHDLVDNRIQLNRMLGLSNLYYIDPEDQEILAELVELRSNLAEAIQRCPEADLERLWATDLGDRYWAMVRSGVQKEPLNPADESRKQAVSVALTPSLGGGGFGSPGALNAFLIAMLYYLPGTMKVDEPQQKLPQWLLSAYEQIFAQPQPVA